MKERPTRAELQRKVRDDTYLDHVRSAMKEFCFTIDPHEGEERVWFGDYTVSINRNVTFNFYSRDVSDDPALDPYPVIRGERTETRELRLRSDPDDPSTEEKIVAFYLSDADYRTAVDSIESIRADYDGLRTLPDAWFLETPLLKLVQRLLTHPRVQEDRSADWPSLLQ